MFTLEESALLARMLRFLAALALIAVAGLVVWLLVKVGRPAPS